MHKSKETSINIKQGLFFVKIYMPIYIYKNEYKYKNVLWEFSRLGKPTFNPKKFIDQEFQTTKHLSFLGSALTIKEATALVKHLLLIFPNHHHIAQLSIEPLAQIIVEKLSTPSISVEKPPVPFPSISYEDGNEFFDDGGMSIFSIFDGWVGALHFQAWTNLREENELPS